VIASSIALLAAQGVAGLWSVYTKIEGYRKVKGVLPNWSQVTRDNLLNLAPTVLRSVSEYRWGLRLRSRRDRRVAVCVREIFLTRFGEIRRAREHRAGRNIAPWWADLDCRVLPGRPNRNRDRPETRSTILFNFWMVIAAAILTTFTMNRLRAVPKAVFALALAGLGLCLAAARS